MSDVPGRSPEESLEILGSLWRAAGFRAYATADPETVGMTAWELSFWLEGWKEAAGLLGQHIWLTTPEPASEIPTPAPLSSDWDDAVAKGALRYVGLHGRRPSQRSGDATPYVGFCATWGNIDSILRDKGLGGIPQFLNARRIGNPLTGSMPADDALFLKAVEEGSALYLAKHHRRPSSRSGDASQYVGFRATWDSINGRLRNIGSGSLRRFLNTVGVGGSFCENSEDLFRAVKMGVAAYLEKNGRHPTRMDGDALPYVGFTTTWGSIDARLRYRGYGGLREFVAGGSLRGDGKHGESNSKE